MKKLLATLLTGLLLTAALSGCGGKAAESTASVSQAPKAAGAAYSEYLSVADVEEITGVTGLKAEEKDLTLRFSGSDATTVYEVKFYGSDYYEEEVGGNRDYYTDVPGIGEKAAICIPDSPYRLVFVKGDRCIMTQTIAKNADGNWLFSEEQLIDIAKKIASKLPD